MWTLLVYLFEGKHYVVQLGGSSPYQSKNEIFLRGTEKEVFSVSGAFEDSFVELLRKFIAGVDKRKIKRIIGTEDLLNIHAGKRSFGTDPPSTN